MRRSIGRGDHQFAETIPLGATGKNVVDNAVYNYTIALAVATSAPADLVFVHEMAFCTDTEEAVYLATWTCMRRPSGRDTPGVPSNRAMTSSTRVSTRARGSSSRTVLRPSSRVTRRIVTGNRRSP